jgi:hypothetical protein
VHFWYGFLDALEFPSGSQHRILSSSILCLLFKYFELLFKMMGELVFLHLSFLPSPLWSHRPDPILSSLLTGGHPSYGDYSVQFSVYGQKDILQFINQIISPFEQDWPGPFQSQVKQNVSSWSWPMTMQFFPWPPGIHLLWGSVVPLCCSCYGFGKSPNVSSLWLWTSPVLWWPWIFCAQTLVVRQLWITEQFGLFMILLTTESLKVTSLLSAQF